VYIGGEISEGIFMRRSVRTRPTCASVLDGASRFEGPEREGIVESFWRR
jgi:hypothetical protein